jgi:hypothetical protein
MNKSAMKPPAGGVSVRMYRQGLGDCFLLAFPPAGDPGEGPYYVLIDCGVLVGTPDAAAKMEAVAKDLLRTTGGHIDLLIATHQHWDHLSGFVQATEVFDQINFGEVWVAWTEDRRDDLAEQLRRRRHLTLHALGASVEKLNAAGPAEKEIGQGVESLLGFFGPLGTTGRLSSIQEAMDYVVGRGDPARFLHPGEGPLLLPKTAGAGVYVLGPPRDEKLLLRSKPSRRSGEVYGPSAALGEDTAFCAALLAADGASSGRAAGRREELRQLSFPFDDSVRLDFAKARSQRFFRDHYFGGGGSKAEQGDLLWRRIDSDWLHAAADLALQLDSDTNNTSLALAFELSPGGRVLLFPGDAQVGNWLSWQALSWKGPRTGGRTVTAEDLLRRTVLYKVGHHASHNATLRERGLELMTSPELVALIPVDETMARKPKGGSPQGWDMPFGPLLRRLEERTAGRVLRADTGIPQRPRRISERDWGRFEGAVQREKLWIQLDIAREED